MTQATTQWALVVKLCAPAEEAGEEKKVARIVVARVAETEAVESYSQGRTQILTNAGFHDVRVAVETPFNLIIETKPGPVSNANDPLHAVSEASGVDDVGDLTAVIASRDQAATRS